MKKVFIVLVTVIGVFALVACSDSKSESTGIKLTTDVTVGQYPDSGKTVRLHKDDIVEDVIDIGNGWVKFKSKGMELTCPKDKLDRSY